MVGAAARGISWTRRVCHLLDLGGLSGTKLLFRSLSLAFLFAGDFRPFATRVVWAEAGLVAGLADFFARAPRPLGPGRFSAHLLLLSRRLLQSVLG